MNFEEWWDEQYGTNTWQCTLYTHAKTIFEAGAKAELDNIRPLVESAIREALNNAGVEYRYIEASEAGIEEFDNLARERLAGVEE